MAALAYATLAAVHAATSQQPQCVPENSVKAQRDGSTKSGATRRN